MSILHDEIAVISGAGSGIGRQVAKLFAKNRASVMLVDRPGVVEEIAMGKWGMDLA